MTSRFDDAVVGVLLGGSTREREVSLNSGAACSAALREAGLSVVEIDWSPGTGARLVDEAGIDVAFLALHGGYGEDGSIQGMLNCAEIPYTGSGVLASALAMDKVRSKRLFSAAALSTAEYVVLTAREIDFWVQTRQNASPVGFPCVVKPAREGSSVGVTIVEEPGRLVEALENARRGDDDILIEAFIPGPEVSVGIFDDECLGSVQIVPAVGFYDYTAKYKSDATQYLIPPPLPGPSIEAAETLAREAFDLLGCRGVARVDLIVDESGKPWLLEVNTLPGMTDHSLVPKLAEKKGISFPELTARMVRSARTDEGVK